LSSYSGYNSAVSDEGDANAGNIATVGDVSGGSFSGD